VVQEPRPLGEFAYRYEKTYSLTDQNTLVIEYSLSNLGAVAWSFNHYNHHWFAIAGGPVDAAYGLRLGFDLPGDGVRATIRGQTLISPTSPPSKTKPFYLAADLADVETRSNTFDLQRGGRKILSYSGEFSPSRFALYATPEGFCPEVFFRAELKPGERVTWRARYHIGDRLD